MQRFSRREFLKAAGVGAVGLTLAACAAPGVAPAQPGGVPAQQPVSITLVESWFGVPQFRESIEPITQALSQKMQSEGLNIEISSLLLDQHEAKYTALYAAGADFTMAFDAPWYKLNTLRDQGALQPIEELVETHGPKLKEAITEKIFDANLINGHLYGVPAAYYYAGTGGVMLREDLRKKYGAPLPTSEEGWASLEPFLQAIADNEPNMLPFVNIATQSMAGYSRNRRGWAPGVIQTGVGIPNIEEGFELMDSEDDPELLEVAAILRDFWEKELINKTDMPSSGTSQNAQIDYIYPGRAASCVENEPEFKWVDQSKQIKASYPEAELFGVDMTGMRGGLYKGLGNLKQWNFIVFNVSAPASQHEAGIQFFDWLAGSQENLDLWLMGIDGVNYIKEPNMRFSEVEGTDATRNYRRQWYVSGMGGRFQRLPADLPAEAEEAIKFYTTEENWIFNPYEQFEADTKALEVDSAKLNAVYLEAVHGLMSGQMPTDEARAFMKKTLDDAGRQVYKEKLQAQLDEFIRAHSA